MRRLFFFLALLCVTLSADIGPTPCRAQTLTLSADSLFNLIDRQNRTIRLKSLYVEDARQGTDVARAQKLPSINASLSVAYLGNGYLTDRDFSDGMKAINPHSHNNFAVEASQIIYSGGAIKGSIALSELNARMAELDLQESRQQVRFLLLGWLIDLQCLHNRRRVLDENITLTQQVLDNMRARFDEGVVLQSDITRYELQLEDLRLQREKTDEAIGTTSYRLANALGLPAEDTVIRPALTPVDPTASIGSESHWQEQALASSLALKKATLGIDASETSLRITGAERRPKIALYAYGRFDSPIVTEVPVINKNFMYWGFGASLTYNISSLYTTRRRERQQRTAVMERRAAYEVGHESLRNDVNAAYEAYRTAVTELRTKEKSVELARQNYDIVSDRFDNGMALITDMVDASNVLLSSQIGMENARTMLLFACYRLKYITNTL